MLDGFVNEDIAADTPTYDELNRAISNDDIATDMGVAWDVGCIQGERETVASKRDLERISDRPIGALAWLEGTALWTNAAAEEALAKAGYEPLFANHAVRRVP